jgi:trans-AT polyketide synthase, acyltransferase and oxidoreductase domains
MASDQHPQPRLGWWASSGGPPLAGTDAIRRALRHVKRPLYLVQGSDGPAAADSGAIRIGDPIASPAGGLPLLAYVPALDPSDLGDKCFKSRHGLRYAYVCGAMANGITSTAMVEAASQAGMIGYFGAAGLSPQRVEEAVETLQNALGDRPYGCNLIHSPNDPALETAIVDLYLRRGVRRISASAYLRLTPQLVRYRVTGIHRGPDGAIVCPNKVKAKVSRVEVASRFFSPPPDKMLSALVAQGQISVEEAELAARIPMADDLTAEADSVGHTDNRPALALLPTMIHLRDRMVAARGYREPICVGLGGGIATPLATAAAFTMGAAYVLAGSVHQACIESGTTDLVRRMLAEAGQADVVMAPAADMFEMGVKVQVLKRGTLFAVRAAKLYDFYRRYETWEAIPAKERGLLEKDFFRAGFEETWQRTAAFFARRDPRQLERAQRDARHKMALVFRSYLGLSSKWPVQGVNDRQLDFQVWCGPAMGAFNEWTTGTFLESPENRDTVTVAMNLLYGAAVVMRSAELVRCGLAMDPEITRIDPVSLQEIQEAIKGQE